jgi:hypothetical protein
MGLGWIVEAQLISVSTTHDLADGCQLRQSCVEYGFACRTLRAYLSPGRASPLRDRLPGVKATSFATRMTTMLREEQLEPANRVPPGVILPVVPQP